MFITANTIIITISILGFLLASHIYRSKHRSKVLVCPLKSDCNAVVNSDFSKLFGLPIEVLGMFYYALMALAYTALIIEPSWQTNVTSFFLLIATTIAFLFSIYLTLVQALAIKQWCLWCLASASMCLVIFITAILNTHLSIVEILANYRDYIMVGLTIGLVLGVGAITIYNILYIKFLKDLRISQTEQDTLHTISQVIWISLIIITISGFSLYLSSPDTYNGSAIFLVKIFILGIIMIGEAMLNILIAPQLIDISSGKRHEHEPGELHTLRRLSFGFSATSLISWYALLLLIVVPQTLNISLFMLIIYYLLALVIGVIASQIIDYRLSHTN